MAAPERFAERSDSSCTAGTVHTWPFATFGCAVQFGRYRDIADFGQPNAPVDLWVHGLNPYRDLMLRTDGRNASPCHAHRAGTFCCGVTLGRPLSRSESPQLYQ